MSGTNEVEIIEGMSHEDYIASSGIGEGKFISRSILFYMFKNGPEATFEKYVNNNPLYQQPKNEGMKIGDKHEQNLLGEPFNVGSDWVKRPKGMKFTTKEGKAWCKEQELKGLIVKEEEDYKEVAVIQQMKKNLNHHGPAADFLALVAEGKLRNSVVIRWKDEETGLPHHIELDADLIKQRIYEIKTGYKHPDKFSTAAADLGYFFQNALYCEGYYYAYGVLPKFIFIYSQSKAPFIAKAIDYGLRHEAVENARAQIMIMRRKIKSENWFPEAESKVCLRPECPPWILYDTDTDGEEFNDD